MLSLPMACCYHRLKSVVMFGTKNGNIVKFTRNMCFILYQKKTKVILIIFDFALLTNPSWILFLEIVNVLYVQWIGMRELMICLLTSLKLLFIKSLHRIGITSMFILLLVNRSTRDHCRIGNCAGTADSLISDIEEMKKMKDIPIHDYTKKRCIDLYPQNNTGNDSDLQVLCSNLHTCMIDWFIFGKETSSFHQ